MVKIGVFVCSCDEAMKKMRGDERMSPENCPMPFDGRRLIFGGFEVIVEA